MVGIHSAPDRRILLSLCLLVISRPALAKPIANWSANYAPCDRHAELLKYGSMNIGVRFATNNSTLVEQFKAAMNFWSKIIEVDWHEDNSRNCSLQLADGDRQLFEPEPDNMAARAQFPDRSAFQGWIIFNPAITLSKAELFRISVHEIGHILGLRHSFNAVSLMYGFDLESSDTLDASDLSSLAAHHKLRAVSLTRPIKLAKP